ncbi:MAG: class I SAM-dependent methyltransferase [Sulfurimonas sp.]|nr:class I SAM-dependent methyltransferase [Sulfurimonas sp.]
MDELVKKIWYEDDHFDIQFTEDYQKKQIQNRWDIFKKIILVHQSKKKKLKVLDLGCGDGINILGIQNILNDLEYEYDITGSDFNELRLKRVKERFENVKVKQIDIINDKIDEKYDLIIFNHVLEHIKDDSLALENIYNILEDDGLLILGVPNEGCFLAQLRNNILHRKTLKYTDHVQFYTIKTLSKKVEILFNINDIYREGFFMPHGRLSVELKKYRIGQLFLSCMLKLFPSQSAGLILGLTKR